MSICRHCQGKGVLVNRSAFGLPNVCVYCHGSGIVKLTIKDLALQDHVCLLYDDLAIQLASAVAFSIEGLKQGECCFYVADEHTVETVKEAFARNGINVRKQINSRALNILTKGESYLSSGHFDPSEMMDYIKDAIKAATRAGFLAFRGTGEMTWALGREPGCNQLIPYETLLDKYMEETKPDMVTLCQYNTKRFHGDELRGALHVHRMVAFDTGRVASNPYYHKALRENSGSPLDQMIDFLRKQEVCN